MPRAASITGSPVYSTCRGGHQATDGDDLRQTSLYQIVSGGVQLEPMTSNRIVSGRNVVVEPQEAFRSVAAYLAEQRVILF